MNEHPSLETATSGSIRFNTDSSKLEIYNGDQWWEIDATSPESHTGQTRGFISGGGTPSQVNIIEFANINSTGNFTNFGDLNNKVNGPAGTADRIRGITSGGYQAPSNAYINNIDFVTIASTGDATNFGDLTVAAGFADGAKAGVNLASADEYTADVTKVGVKYVSGDLTFNVGFASGDAEDKAIGATGGSNDAKDVTSASVSYAVAAGVTALLGYTSMEASDEGSSTDDGSAWYIGANMAF